MSSNLIIMAILSTLKMCPPTAQFTLHLPKKQQLKEHAFTPKDTFVALSLRKFCQANLLRFNPDCTRKKTLYSPRNLFHKLKCL